MSERLQRSAVAVAQPWRRREDRAPAPRRVASTFRRRLCQKSARASRKAAAVATSVATRPMSRPTTTKAHASYRYCTLGRPLGHSLCARDAPSVGGHQSQGTHRRPSVAVRGNQWRPMAISHTGGTLSVQARSSHSVHTQCHTCESRRAGCRAARKPFEECRWA